MNRSYRIDRDTVVVTDESGKMRMMPKYTHIEDILTLENEIEEIGEEIAKKNVAVEDNTKNKFYIHHKEIDKAFMITFSLALICAIGMPLTAMIPTIASLLYPFAIGFVCAFSLNLLTCYGDSKVKNCIFQNEQLYKDICWLQAIQNQRQRQKEKLQQSIDKDLLAQAEKPLPQPVSPIEELQKLEEILKNAKTDATVHTFIQEIIEEDGKMKILSRFQI